MYCLCRTTAGRMGLRYACAISKENEEAAAKTSRRRRRRSRTSQTKLFPLWKYPAFRGVGPPQLRDTITCRVDRPAVLRLSFSARFVYRAHQNSCLEKITAGLGLCRRQVDALSYRVCIIDASTNTPGPSRCSSPQHRLSVHATAAEISSRKASLGTQEEMICH